MEILREELRSSNWNLQHCDPIAFSISRWQIGNQVSGRFLFYRFVVAAWSFAVLITSVVHEWDRETAFSDRNYLQFWPIYMTNLAFFGLTVHLVLSACVLVERLLNNEARMTVLVRLSWLTYNISTLLGLGITVAFWSFGNVSDPRNPLTILKHGVNSIVLLIDLWISARPCRILHFYQPLCVSFCYMMFSLVYWLAGGKNHHGYDYIYDYIDWSNFPSKWPFIVLLILMVLPMQILIWFLHLLRDKLHQRVVERRKVSDICYDNPAMQPESFVSLSV